MKKVSFKKGIQELGYTIQKYSKGYNFRSAFATDENGNLFYFSIEDLRDADPGIMYRTAESLTDYRGGSNTWDFKHRLSNLGMEVKENRTGKDFNSN
jgi:hypothetical protein